MTENQTIVLEEYHSGNIMAIPYGCDIRTPEQRQAQQKHAERLELRKADERGNFVILNLEYLHQKLKDVSYLELGYAMLLLPYITYLKDDKPYLPLGTEVSPFTYEKLSEVWNLQPDSVRKLVKLLVDKRILVSTIDKLDKRKRVVHFSKRLVAKGKMPKNYKMYTKVYQYQLEIGIALMYEKHEKREAAKAIGLFTLLLKNLNEQSQLLLVDDEKAEIRLEGENIADFFVRLRIASKNATTINKMKELVGITDNRGIKKSLALLQQVGMLNQVMINKKKAYMINPACASKQDNSKFELYCFTLYNFFGEAMVSKLLKYQAPVIEDEDGR